MVVAVAIQIFNDHSGKGYAVVSSVGSIFKYAQINQLVRFFPQLIDSNAARPSYYSMTSDFSFLCIFFTSTTVFGVEQNLKAVDDTRNNVSDAQLSSLCSIIHSNALAFPLPLGLSHHHRAFDVVFIDAAKNFYLPMFSNFVAQGIIRRGTLVLADNVVVHEKKALAYLNYVRGHPSMRSMLWLPNEEPGTDGVEVTLVMDDVEPPLTYPSVSA
jgi:hypothetical protein